MRVKVTCWVCAAMNGCYALAAILVVAAFVFAVWKGSDREVVGPVSGGLLVAAAIAFLLPQGLCELRHTEREKQ